MKHVHVSILMAFLLSTAGCGESAGDDDANNGGSAGSGGSGGSGVSGTSPGGSGGGSSCNSTTITANKVNNYTFSSTLTLPPVSVKPESDLTIDWSAVTKDFMKHDLVASTVNVMLFELPLSELETKMNSDELKSKDATTPIYAPMTAGQTSANLFSFLTPADEPLTPDQILPYFNATDYPPEANTYTVILADGELAASGQARMIQSFKLDPAATSTTVALSNTSTTLTYTTDLDSLQPTLIPAATPAITINWRDMTETALGGEFLPQQITEARIAHYTETPAELETQFLDLEYIDEATYEATVASGVSISLDQFKDSGGATFPGITADGTWILALICGQCRNPAPWYLTILKPCQ